MLVSVTFNYYLDGKLYDTKLEYHTAYTTCTFQLLSQDVGLKVKQVKWYDESKARGGYFYTGSFQISIRNCPIIIDVYYIGQKYSVTLNPGEGTGGGTYNYLFSFSDAVISDVNVPSRAGYKIKHWNGTVRFYTVYDGKITIEDVMNLKDKPTITISSETKTMTISGSVFGNSKLTPEWEAISYKINVMDNGGSGGVGTTYNYSTSSQTCTITAPTLKGNKIASWNSSLTGVSVSGNVVKLPAGACEDIELTPNWEVNNYTIKIDANGGYGGSGTTYQYRTSAQSVFITPPKKDGYTLKGYVSSVSGIDVGSDNLTVTIQAGVQNDCTLLAQWSMGSYSIKVVNNGGSGGAGTTYSYSSSSQTRVITVPTLTEHHITSWSSSLAGVSVSGNTVTLPAGAQTDITLTPTWGANAYTITVDPNGGSGGGGTTYHYSTYKQSITITAPTRSNYKVSGYSSSVSGISVGTDNTTVNISAGTSGNCTLAAKWTLDSYNVTFNSNGGTGTMASQTIKKDSGTSLTPNAFTRSGYTFLGWNTSSSSTTALYSDKQSVNSLGTSPNVTLYAIWKISIYTVTVESNNKEYGTVSISGGPFTPINNTATLTATPKSGFVFEQWNKWNGTAWAKVEGMVASCTVTVTGDAKYQAVFTGSTYTVICKNGSLVVTTLSGKCGSSVTLPDKTEVIKTGYQLSWSVGGASYAAGATYVIGPSNVTANAVWTANKYTVSFKSNSSGKVTGSVADKQYTYDATSEVVPATNNYVRTGYTVDTRWNTQSDGLGSWVAAGTHATALNLTSVNNATVLLYAIWNANKYKIEVTSTAGGTVTGGGDECPYDSTQTIVATANCGNAFKKWEKYSDE